MLRIEGERVKMQPITQEMDGIQKNFLTLANSPSIKNVAGPNIIPYHSCIPVQSE